MAPSRFRVRNIFRPLVVRLARPFIKYNVNPDTLTYFTLLLSLFALFSLNLFVSEPLYGVFVFLVGLFDGIDGAVARGLEKSSATGAFTDSVVDKVAEVILLFSILLRFSGITVLSISVASWVVLCICGWLLTSYTRSRAEALGVENLDVGLGARSERLLLLSIASLLFQTLYGLVLVTLLGVLTAAYRYAHYSHELAQKRPIPDHHT